MTRPPGFSLADHPPERFATTRWSIVLAAGREPEPEAQRALASLCEAYWYPLYAYARRRGYSAQDAQDGVQAFFAEVLEKDWLRSADRERGRFRTFLLTVFRRFLAKEREKAAAQKRGGGKPQLSIDFASAEQRYRLEPSHSWTPERVYERRWALTVLDEVLAALREEYAAKGKQRLFDGLKACLAGPSGTLPYARVAEELSMTEGAVKVAVHRLRQRYRELLRAEIAQTVASAGEVDDELNRLLGALRGEDA